MGSTLMGGVKGGQEVGGDACQIGTPPPGNGTEPSGGTYRSSQYPEEGEARLLARAHSGCGQ